MDKHEHDNLLRAWKTIRENVEPKDLLNHLYQNQVISMTQYEDLKETPKRSNRVQLMLTNVYTSQVPGTFQIFNNALQECGYGFISEELTSITGINTGAGWLHTVLTEAGRRRTITESELALISSHIGSEWTMLAQLLDIPKSQVQQIEQSHSYSVQVQCQNMLVKWRNKNGSQATVEHLVNKLHVLDINEDSYRSVIMEKSGIVV